MASKEGDINDVRVEHISYADAKKLRFTLEVRGDNIMILQNLTITLVEHPEILRKLVEHTNHESVQDTITLIGMATLRVAKELGLEIPETPITKVRV